MTPSEAYAALHEKWPELRPTAIVSEFDHRRKSLVYVGNVWRWQTTDEFVFGVLDDCAALALCFVACLEACAERWVEVIHHPSWADGWHVFRDDNPNCIGIPSLYPHTITAVMDRVMQLPEVPRA